jgi:hypothetical protein
MSSQVISFAMSDRGGSVGVGGEVVEFCESIVRALGHGVLRASGIFGCNTSMRRLVGRTTNLLGL